MPLSRSRSLIANNGNGISPFLPQISDKNNITSEHSLLPSITKTALTGHKGFSYSSSRELGLNEVVQHQLYTDDQHMHAQGEVVTLPRASVGNTQLPDVGQNGSIPSDDSTEKNGVVNGKTKPTVVVPEQVMKLFAHKLTPYEHHEIFGYSQIYFIGANAKKRQGAIGAPNNCGYDDEHGSYLHVPHDHIAYRYEMLKIIGKGSFGS